jgi:hypothetical protein
VIIKKGVPQAYPGLARARPVPLSVEPPTAIGTYCFEFKLSGSICRPRLLLRFFLPEFHLTPLKISALGTGELALVVQRPVLDAIGELDLVLVGQGLDLLGEVGERIALSHPEVVLQGLGERALRLGHYITSFCWLS